MAETYSDIGAVFEAPTASTLIPGSRYGARIHYMDALVTVASGATANDTVKLFKLPAGAIIIPELSSVTSEGMGTGATMTVDVGDNDGTGVADRYADGLNVAAAGLDLFTAGTLPVTSLTPHKLAAESWVILKFATLSGGSPTGKTLRVKVAYTKA